MIYLDANATTPIRPEAAQAMVRALEQFGNASSVHSVGQRARAAVDAAREQCAAALKADPRDLVFTSGGTEADALAIYGGGQSGTHIVTTAVEHPAVLGTSALLEKSGFEVTRVGVDADGGLDLDELQAALARPGTGLCSAMLANNETGVLFPAERIGELCRSRGVLFHVDAVQAAGKVPIDLSSLPADYVSISGHKLRGPQGVGLLWIRRGAPLQPLQSGGHQERGRRAGTENVAAIAGLGVALELAVRQLADSSHRLGGLRDSLEASVLRIDGAQVHGAGSPRVANTSCMSFAGCEGQTLLVALDVEGICVSTGSACSSGSLEPSPVLLAMGIPRERAQGALRFSLWSGNTEAEIARVAEVLPRIVARCKA